MPKRPHRNRDAVRLRRRFLITAIALEIGTHSQPLRRPPRRGPAIACSCRFRMLFRAVAGKGVADRVSLDGGWISCQLLRWRGPRPERRRRMLTYRGSWRPSWPVAGCWFRTSGDRRCSRRRVTRCSKGPYPFRPWRSARPRRSGTPSVEFELCRRSDGRSLKSYSTASIKVEGLATARKDEGAANPAAQPGAVGTPVTVDFNGDLLADFH